MCDNDPERGGLFVYGVVEEIVHGLEEGKQARDFLVPVPAVEECGFERMAFAVFG